MKSKVLQIIGSLEIGGAETVAMNLYRYINRDKYEFHYLVYGNKVGVYEAEVIQLGGKVIHLEYSILRFWKFKKEFLHIIEKYGPYKIVHTHMMFHNGILLKLADKMHVPVRISHAHSTSDGYIVERRIGNAIRAIYRKQSRNLIKRYGNLFMACGQDAGNYLYGKKFFGENGYMIKNGIDIKKFIFNEVKRNAIKNKYQIENNRVYACIGHLDPVKNHKFLIHVFEQIVRVDKRAFLLIIGEGRLKKEIEQLCIDIDIMEQVMFTGNVDNVFEWMQAIDFLLMPSLFEGLPVTLIEAQAAGLKCFVSDKVSLEADITGRVQYISLDDIENWVAIAGLDEKYDRNIDYTLKMINAGYSVKENVELLEKIYDEKLT